MNRHRYFIIILLILMMAIPVSKAAGQTSAVRPPVSMMVLIDNSCSMFPANQIIAGCDAWGSDVNFVRITGANLFIARLGFGEPNESDYQLGVISVGDEPDLLSPLKPLVGIRDSLAKQIASPKAQPATRMVPALKLAYDQIQAGKTARPGNTPAVVMITDGVPWPREGQSDAAIEELAAAHEDTQLFIMLLQNKDKNSTDYENYIRFWQDLQTRYNHIFVYRLTDAAEIQGTYNTILGRLQNTLPSESQAVKARTPVKFYVSNYLSRIVITVVRQNARTDPGVVITDAKNVKVTASDTGVDYFKGTSNPVDVYALDSARLDAGGRGQYWTVSTTKDTTILLDRQGSYRVNLLSPAFTASPTANLYKITERQSPTDEIRVRFNLLDEDNNPILESQPVSGSLILPDGKTTALKDLAALRPDSGGVYDFGLMLSSLYPAIEDSPGRFTIILNAGTVADTGTSAKPVASVNIQMDAGKLPYIRSAAPLPVTCEPSQPFLLRVSVGDYDTVLEGSISVTLTYKDTLLIMEQKEPGIYQADLQQFCSTLIRQQVCSTQQNYNLSIQLDAQIAENYPLETVTREIQAQALGPACTATPIPTLTPTLQPTGTPVPDSDKDGILDSQDRCPTQSGWGITDGCVPWAGILTGLGALGLVGFTSTFFFRWVKVHTFGEPPSGYLLAVRDGKVELGPVDLHDLGMKRRASRLVVGSDSNLAHIYIPGLKSIEFYVERKSVLSFLREPGQKKAFAFLNDEKQLVHTSDPHLVFYLSLKAENITE